MSSDHAGGSSSNHHGATPSVTPSRAELQQSLARVHAELAAAPHIDQRSAALLREVLADIERLLHDHLPSPGAAAARSGAAASGRAATAPSSAVGRATSVRAPERLEGLAVQFENRHPVLAATVRQFVELLARAGL